MNQEIVEAFNLEIGSLPEGFFRTFRYTITGNNLTHPVTLGAIARVVAELPEVAHVGIDVRLNYGGGVKFQPDVVGFDVNFHPLVIVDYESPNSSDARVPVKDWLPFARWRSTSGRETPYFVVTTLPEHCPAWELRYTAKGQYNYEFRGRLNEIRANPFAFWYNYYRSVASEYDLLCINMVNINNRLTSMVQLDSV